MKNLNFILILFLLISCSKKEDQKKNSAEYLKYFFLREESGVYKKIIPHSELKDSDLLYFSNDDLEEKISQQLLSELNFRSGFVIFVTSKCEAQGAIEEESFFISSNQMLLKQVIPARIYLLEANSAVCTINFSVDRAGSQSDFILINKEIILTENKEASVIYRDSDHIYSDGVIQEVDFENLSLQKLDNTEKVFLNCTHLKGEANGTFENLKDINEKLNIVWRSAPNQDIKEAWDPRNYFLDQRCLFTIERKNGLRLLTKTFQIKFKRLEPILELFNVSTRSDQNYYYYKIKAINPYNLPLHFLVDKSQLVASLGEGQHTYLELKIDNAYKILNSPSGSYLYLQSGWALVTIAPSSAVDILAYTSKEHRAGLISDKVGTPFYSLQIYDFDFESRINSLDELIYRKIPIHFK